MDEFWRNRRTVLKQNQGRHRERDEIEESFASINKTLHAWHRRVVDRAASPPKPALNALSAASDEILRLMEAKTAEAAATTAETPTYDDRGARETGAPSQGSRRPCAEAGATEMSSSETASNDSTGGFLPGYMDGGKSPERAVGDYFVWAQTMQAAKERGMGVLLVTNDQKEDWWAEGGNTRLARPELVAELLEYAGQPLVMMRSHELVAMGGLLGVDGPRSHGQRGRAGRRGGEPAANESATR